MAQKGLSQGQGQLAANLPSLVPFDGRSSSVLHLDEGSFCPSSFGKYVVPGLVCCVVEDKIVGRKILKTRKRRRKRKTYISFLYYASNQDSCLWKYPMLISMMGFWWSSLAICTLSLEKGHVITLFSLCREITENAETASFLQVFSMALPTNVENW